MQTAFSLLLSVFVVIALGAALGRTRLFGESSVTALNAFVWHIAVPAYMFRTMAANELPGTEEFVLVLVYYGTALTVYALLGLASGVLFDLEPGERPAIALSGCFSNGVMLGAPIVGGAFGESVLPLLFMLIAFHAPTYVTLSTLWLEIERGERAKIGPTLRRSAISLTRQTPIIALLLGIAVSALDVEVPGLLAQMLAMLAGTMVPLGLFAVGLSLSRIEINGDLPQASLATLTKLMLLPAAMLLTTRLAGLPPSWCAVATVMAGLPTGIVAFNFSVANTAAPRRVATAFLLANVLSIATLTFWIGWLD